MAKRNYVEEILQKKSRNHKNGSRNDIFLRRVHPLVEGFRQIRALDKSINWREEWLKYGAIGYVACVEGYIRLLIADVINQGQPYLDRVSNFKEIKFNAEIVVALQKKRNYFRRLHFSLTPYQQFVRYKFAFNHSTRYRLHKVLQTAIVIGQR